MSLFLPQKKNHPKVFEVRYFFKFFLNRHSTRNIRRNIKFRFSLKKIAKKKLKRINN